MAIFKKTEPGLLYELSPGRDGRLLVWSPGLMRYQYCTSLDDMEDVNSNYLEQDIDDGCWFYQLPSLVDGDNMFYNDAIAELYEGRVPLWHFESTLQSLQSGVNMFKGCSLDAVSVKRIADTLSDTDPGTITLGIHYSLEGDSSVAASLSKIENKGWSVETEYNLPYGYTPLDYLESSGTQRIDTEVLMRNSTIINCRALATSVATNANNYLYGVVNSAAECILTVRHQTTDLATVQIGTYKDGSIIGDFERYFDVTLGTPMEVTTDGISSATINAETQDSKYPTIWSATAMPIPIFCNRRASVLNSAGDIEGGGSYKLYYFNITLDGTKQREFVPVLDQKGQPCLFDKISNRCFYNTGSGKFGYRITGKDEEVAPTTFSLRDPYYVAPSGVYARLVAENELDIVADTDMTSDIAEQYGYTWFANTGEAYEQFGITQQPDGKEAIDA